jgi:hypothetical protein
MKNKIFYFCIALITLFSSCDLEKVISYELPYEGDKLVVWSYIQPNESVEVKVYQTYPPLGADTLITIADAIVELFEDDILVAILEHSEKGIYNSSFYPTIGKFYHLKVTAPNFEEIVISEKVQIPNKPSILNVFFTDSLNFPNNQIEGIFEIKINTASTTHISFKEILASLDSTTSASLRILSTSYYNDCTEKFGIYNGIGMATKCLIDKERIYFNFNYSDFKRPESVIFNLSTLSDSYVKFYLSLENTDIEQGLSFISEPVNVYTNMQGGYGILAAYNPFEYEFEL